MNPTAYPTSYAQSPRVAASLEPAVSLTTIHMRLRYFLPTTLRERRRSNITFVEPADIAVMWSPKAACTTVITWAFKHNGLLEEALNFSPWVHRYRLRHYQRTERYLGRLRRLDRHSRYVVKVVRNPFERAVSSFVHAYRHDYEDFAMRDMLGRPVDRQHRFSFREFVDLLERSNLNRCNPHHRLQSTPVERHVLFGLKPHRIVKIEDGLERALNEIEQQHNLPATDLTTPVFQSQHHTSRATTSGLAADRTDLSEPVLPPAAAFYDDDLVTRVARLYAEDFDRYDYDTKLAQ